MYYNFDDPRRFAGKNLWWMSFPKIESRELKSVPDGDPPAFDIGDRVILKEKPLRKRRILKIEWHYHRYQWVYIIETSASDLGGYFEPYWFEDKLKKIEE